MPVEPMHQPVDTESIQPEASPRRGVETLDEGTVVANRYEIGRVVGVGGSSVVYAAFDRTLRREIALKVLRPDRVTDSSLLRLRREVNVAREVQSPYLVPIYDIGELGNGAWLTMELVEGVSLQSLILDRRQSIERTLEIAEEVLEALRTLHEEGIVHRDVKPGNIMVEPSGKARLADLGLARRWDSRETRATDTEGLVGTLEYLSPEQALGHDLDGRTDLYSFGVVLYELLTGEPPFKSRSSIGTVLAHVSDAAADVRQARPDAPRWLANVIARLLAKRREERYQTADEVLSDIRGQRTDWRFAFRRARVRVVIAALLLATTIGGTLGGKAWYESRFDRLVRHHPDGLEAQDRRGRALWSISRANLRFATTAKLRQWEPTRVVAILTDPLERNTDESHVLSILDKQTGRILRTVSMPQDYQHMGGFSNSYTARALDTVDLDHDGIDEIVVSYAHSPYWPSYATYYDPAADDVRTILRASGHHVAAGTADFDDDGLDEVLFYGINNRMGAYNTLAVVSVRGERLVPAEPAAIALGDSGVVASSPDAEYFRSTVDAMLWYTLLPSPHRQFGQPLIDTSLRRITIEHPGQEPTIVDFDGFLAGTASALPPAERQQARASAYSALRSGIRMLESDRGDAALEHLTEAAQHAQAAADPILVEWIARNELRVLIRAQRVSEAEQRLEVLIPSASSPGDVAWDTARAMHIEGHLEQAARLYLRGLGLNPNIDQGRKKYEYLEGAILALGELGQWDEARHAVRQFEVAYPEQISLYADDFHTYIDWRSTGRISPGPVSTGWGADLQLYWRLEFEALGEIDESFVDRIDNRIGRASECITLLRSLRADALFRLGRHAEAQEEIRRAWSEALVESATDTAVRAHLDLVRERFERITGEGALP